MLNSVNITINAVTVPHFWNLLEVLLINAIDTVAPLITFCSNTKTKTTTFPNHIKNALNKRKRLLNIDKLRNSSLNLTAIKSLNKVIKEFHLSNRISDVKRAVAGPNGNIWHAVKRAKNLVHEDIPSNLTLGGLPVARGG